MIKERRKSLPFLCRTVIGICYYKFVNETGAFGIPPDKGNRDQYFVYTLLFFNQLVYKQAVLACYIYIYIYIYVIPRIYGVLTQ